MTDTDWKARAEAAEARISWFENQISHYKEDLRVQKASHEMRVKELEARRRSLTEDVMTLGTMVYDENAVKWRERALVAERRIVNDDMVKMAMQRILKDWKAEDVFVRPELEAAEIASIAATAALASVDAAPVPRLTVTDETEETIKARAAVIICETGAVCNNGANPDCKSREVAAALFDAGLLRIPPTITDKMLERAKVAVLRVYEEPAVEWRDLPEDELKNRTAEAIARAALTAALEEEDD